METGSDREVCILKQTLRATERPLFVSSGPDAIVHISCAELNKDRNQSLGLKKGGKKHHVWFSHEAMIPLPFLVNAGSQGSSVSFASLLESGWSDLCCRKSCLSITTLATLMLALSLGLSLFCVPVLSSSFLPQSPVSTDTSLLSIPPYLG